MSQWEPQSLMRKNWQTSLTVHISGMIVCCLAVRDKVSFSLSCIMMQGMWDAAAAVVVVIGVLLGVMTVWSWPPRARSGDWDASVKRPATVLGVVMVTFLELALVSLAVRRAVLGSDLIFKKPVDVVGVLLVPLRIPELLALLAGITSILGPISWDAGRDSDKGVGAWGLSAGGVSDCKLLSASWPISSDFTKTKCQMDLFSFTHTHI